MSVYLNSRFNANGGHLLLALSLISMFLSFSLFVNLWLPHCISVSLFLFFCLYYINFIRFPFFLSTSFSLFFSFFSINILHLSFSLSLQESVPNHTLPHTYNLQTLCSLALYIIVIRSFNASWLAVSLL